MSPDDPGGYIVSAEQSTPKSLSGKSASGEAAVVAAGSSSASRSDTTRVLHGTAVVWKFVVGMPDERGRSFVEIPNEAELLSVGLQDDRLVVWTLTDSLNEPHIHRLLVANTGMSIPDFPPGARFLGTVTTSNGIVWHVWDTETTA